nr:uncharacterized protein LOC105846451 isoform X2 [Hydra vulgaris]
MIVKRRQIIIKTFAAKDSEEVADTKNSFVVKDEKAEKPIKTIVVEDSEEIVNTKKSYIVDDTEGHGSRNNKMYPY